MYSQYLQLVEDSDFVYIIAHRKTFKVIDGNKLAKIYFSADPYGNFADLKEIFDTDFDSIKNMLDALPKVKYMKLSEVKSRKQCGNEFDCEVELRYLKEYDDIIFLVIKEKTSSDTLIKRCIELSKKVEFDQQYFDVMQEYSKDVFFRIDIKKKTMVHRGDIAKINGLIPVIENYPESMRENEVIHPDDLEGYMKFAYDLLDGIPGVYEARVQLSDRTYERYKLQGKALYDNDGNVTQMIGKSENIQKLVDVSRNSTNDVLSSLAMGKENFVETVDSISTSIESMEVDYTFVLFDFDDFKQVNEKYGNIFGDFVIENAGKRIKNCIRSTDKLGRVGVDQFVVLFEHTADNEVLVQRTDIIQNSLNREYNDGEYSYRIKASVGISSAPRDGVTYRELYDKAYTDLKNARKRGQSINFMINE